MSSYRKLYENLIGPIPKDNFGRSYEIHHIDGNRNNNEINNLIALSIEDHLKIHQYQNDKMASFLIQQRLNSINYDIDEFKRYMRENNPSSKMKGENHWTRQTVFVKDKNNNFFRVKKNDHRIKSGKFIICSPNKNKITVKYANSETDKCFQVDKDDPRIKTGELIHPCKGRKFTEEQKNRIRASRKPNPPWSKERREKQLANNRPAWNKGLKLKK